MKAQRFENDKTVLMVEDVTENIGIEMKVSIVIGCPNCGIPLAYAGGFLATDGPRHKWHCENCGLFASTKRLPKKKLAEVL